MRDNVGSRRSNIDVAAEHRVVRAPLVIETNDRLRVVVIERDAVADLATWIGGNRQALGHFDGRLTEERWIDLVVHERHAQCDRPARVARG